MESSFPNLEFRKQKPPAYNDRGLAVFVESSAKLAEIKKACRQFLYKRLALYQSSLKFSFINASSSARLSLPYAIPDDPP